MFQLTVGDVVECVGCQLGSLVDRRTGQLVACEYGEHYFNRDKNHGSVGYSDYFGAEQPVRRQIAAVLADAVYAVVPETELRTLVDIGCGGGYLVHALSQLGIAAVGVDPSAYAVSRARNAGPGRFIVGDVAAAQHIGPFDAATMIDVVEHVPDPVALVRSARAVVRPRGRLFILTPRFGGRLLADQGDRYVHFNLDHVHYLTEATLRDVTELAAPAATTEIIDVAEVPSMLGVRSNPAFQHKYISERDSMLAIIRLSEH